MSTGYQIDDPFGTYFLTPTVVDWVDVFTRSIYRDIIIKSLDYCIREKALDPSTSVAVWQPFEKTGNCVDTSEKHWRQYGVSYGRYKRLPVGSTLQTADHCGLSNLRLTNQPNIVFTC